MQQQGMLGYIMMLHGLPIVTGANLTVKMTTLIEAQNFFQ